MSNWELNEVNTTGNQEKHWLISPDDKQDWLFKFARPRRTEHCSEHICSAILQALELEAPEIVIAEREGRIGSLSKKFVVTEREELHEGALFLDVGGLSPGVVDEQYTLDLIMERLRPLGLAQQFLAIPIFDAFVGHCDRHSGNWGIIKNREGIQVRLAPIYDNASALGGGELEVTIEKRLGDRQSYESFLLRKSKSVIRVKPGKPPQHMEMVRYILQKYPETTLPLLDRIARLSDRRIEAMIQSVAGLMSSSRTTFTYRILKDRRDLLVELRKEFRND